jgi:5'-nucleotidase
MRILLTNDDGVHASGLKILRDFLREKFEVIVVAPQGERTGISHAISLRDPVRLWEVEEGVWASDGTPVDCVHLALKVILKEPPHLVISGPNNGPNMGEEIFYSGTVAAALESSILGIQAIAISMAARKDHFYETAARVVFKLIERLSSNPLPPKTILNVNVPNLPWEFIAGFKLTRPSRRVFNNYVVEALDPRGAKFYWIGGKEPEFVLEEGTDAHAVANGFVSITPLRADLTAYEELEKINYGV